MEKIMAILIICFDNLLFNGGAAHGQVADTAVHAKTAVYEGSGLILVGLQW